VSESRATTTRHDGMTLVVLRRRLHVCVFRSMSIVIPLLTRSWSKQARKLALQDKAALLEFNDVVVREDVNVERSTAVCVIEHLRALASTDQDRHTRMKRLVAELAY
jgi:hypothetical protein